MTDEKLIEEAAAKRYPHRDVFLEGMAYMSEERSRIPLREAFVEGAKWQAEKAHTPKVIERHDLVMPIYEDEDTPTDDEREAQGWREAELYADDHEPSKRAETADDFMAGWRTADRVRSVVPEPSAEEWAARVDAVREKAIAKGYTPEHDAKHGVRHLLNWAIDYARRGRPEDSSGLVAAAIDLAGIAYAELERLRHVADTMSAVSEALRTRYASDSQAAYFMRQIDAALEAIPEPQGEPSDAQVQAAFDAFYLSDDRVGGLTAIRAALRAAGGVR